jgi:hypothetical protein
MKTSGVQTFLSKTSQRTKQPQFDAERNVVVMKTAHVMHLMVHCLKAHNFLALQRSPIGVATIDLQELFSDAQSTDAERSKRYTLELWKPTHHQVKDDMKQAEQGLTEDEPDPVIGTISVRVEIADIEQLEEAFWTGLIQIVDWDDSGTLDKEVWCLLCCLPFIWHTSSEGLS